MSPDQPIPDFNTPQDEHGSKQPFSPLLIILLLILVAVTLAGLLVPIYYGFYPRRSVYTKAMATKASLSNLKQALMAFEIDCERFPTTKEGLASLVDAPVPIPPGWHQYLDAPLKDGWGRPFIYVCPAPDGTNFDLYSTGADGIDGTPDDIHLRDLE